MHHNTVRERARRIYKYLDDPEELAIALAKAQGKPIPKRKVRKLKQKHLQKNNIHPSHHHLRKSMIHFHNIHDYFNYVLSRIDWFIFFVFRKSKSKSKSSSSKQSAPKRMYVLFDI